MFFRGFMFGGGPIGNEPLDQPLSNFDVIGIPTGQWSSNICACYQNIVPSCIVSFCCPCIMWAQIVVRAQIPLLIGIKNSLSCFRGKSGYGFFVDVFFWSLAILLLLFLVAGLVGGLPHQITYLFYALAVGLSIVFIYIVSHTRTAFREKYRLPGCCPKGAEFWSMFADCFVVVLLLPCSLAQMARHVFQYDRMNPKLGLFLGDPFLIPPLPPRPDEEVAEGAGAGGGERPIRADQAGLTWTYDGPHPDARDNRGAAHRQEEILQRQRNDLINNNEQNSPLNQNRNSAGRNNNNSNNNNNGLPYATATAVPSAPSPHSYRSDGTKI